MNHKLTAFFQPRASTDSVTAVKMAQPATATVSELAKMRELNQKKSRTFSEITP